MATATEKKTLVEGTQQAQFYSMQTYQMMNLVPDLDIAALFMLARLDHSTFEDLKAVETLKEKDSNYPVQVLRAFVTKYDEATRAKIEFFVGKLQEQAMRAQMSQGGGFGQQQFGGGMGGGFGQQQFGGGMGGGMMGGGFGGGMGGGFGQQQFGGGMGGGMMGGGFGGGMPGMGMPGMGMPGMGMPGMGGYGYGPFGQPQQPPQGGNTEKNA